MTDHDTALEEILAEFHTDLEATNFALDTLAKWTRKYPQFETDLVDHCVETLRMRADSDERMPEIRTDSLLSRASSRIETILWEQTTDRQSSKDTA